jgi:ribosomal protein S18
MREGRGRSSEGRGGRGGEKKDDKKRTLFRRRKVCKFCADKIDDINYKDVKLLGAPYLGHLRHASAQTTNRHQARASAGVDTVRY